MPQLEKVPAANLRIADASGQSLDAISAGRQVQIISDVKNYWDRTQAFVYLVQVQDSDGFTAALGGISGILEAGQSFSPAVSWMPSKADAYDATAFLWESVDNPVALLPPVSTAITAS